MKNLKQLLMKKKTTNDWKKGMLKSSDELDKKEGKN